MCSTSGTSAVYTNGAGANLLKETLVTSERSRRQSFVPDVQRDGLDRNDDGARQSVTSVNRNCVRHLVTRNGHDVSCVPR